MTKTARETALEVNLINEPIHPTACYTYHEAALLTKSSYDTIYRSIASGNLIASGAGRLRVVLGENLLAWVRDGMHTGRL